MPIRGVRDVEPGPARPPLGPGLAPAGPRYIAVIGIDRYRAWSRLSNAVRDAQGTLAAFARLGFEPASKPLFNEDATRDALHDLVTDGLGGLGADDSLVLFFAGHGHTAPIQAFDDPDERQGYLIPVDGDRAGGKVSTWLRIDHWLRDAVSLRPRHILIILDACHSGIALDHLIRRLRGDDAQPDGAWDLLRARRSRRVITSALADQRARDDGGPLRGHSLFTGWLIQALSGGLLAQTRSRFATGAILGEYVRARVAQDTGSEQTPDCGPLEYDHSGQLVMELGPAEPPPSKPKRPRPANKRPRSRLPVERSPAERPRTPEAPPDAALFEALDRHDEARRSGARALSLLAGDAADVLAAWATWAAHRGYLVHVTERDQLDDVIGDVLAGLPWLRCLPAARARLAVAARLDEEAVDAALDARSGAERSRWIEHVAGLDLHARVSGWVLSSLREPSARVPDLATAPAQGGELLSIVCDLAVPIAVLFHRPEPTQPWLECAIAAASTLTGYLPRRSVAVGAPDELVARALRSRESAALAMARQGLVTVAAATAPAPARPRVGAVLALRDALARDPRTRGRFELNSEVPSYEGGPVVDVDLVARDARLAVEIDGWYQFQDPRGYRRDRLKDARLQRAGFFVMRFLAEDVEERLAYVVDEIVLGLGGRRIQRIRGGFL